MSEYNPNCKACRWLVYGVPILAIPVGAIGIYALYDHADMWLTFFITIPIYLPLSFKLGKHLPMTHEWARERFL